MGKAIQLGRLRTFSVTRRSRNLGIGWTNEVVSVQNPRNGKRSQRVAPVEGPSVVGSLRDVATEYDRACKLHADGTAWRCEFFVGSTPVDSNEFLAARRSLLGNEEGGAGRSTQAIVHAAPVSV